MHHTETVAIAARLLGLRQLRNVTQMELATHIGVSYQQLQKYERGHNRISPAMLQRCAEYLSVPIDYFFSEHSRSPGGNGASRNMEIAGLDPADRKMRREFSALPSNLQDSIRSLVAGIHDVQLGQKGVDERKAARPARLARRTRAVAAAQTGLTDFPVARAMHPRNR